MQVLVLTVKLYAPWVQSLKEKRMVVKSLTARMKNRFNASVREAEEQDTHKTAIIELAALCTGNAEADGLEEQMIGFCRAEHRGTGDGVYAGDSVKK